MYTLEKIHLKYFTEGQTKEYTLSADNPVLKTDYIVFEFRTEECLSGERLTGKINTEKQITLSELKIYLKRDYQDVRSIFANGFQSWSESKLYQTSDQIKPLRKIAHRYAANYGDSTYHNYSGAEGEIHSWGHTYLNLPDKKIHFIGSLDEKNAFSNFIHLSNHDEMHIVRDVNSWEITGEVTIYDFFQTENTETSAFQHYFMLFEQAESKVKPAVGWTSWYNYYNKISEEIILKNLKNFTQSNLPIDVFQIDDGYQSRVGDWLSVNDRFPNGMKSLAQKIKSAGFQAGIWVAPFVAEKKSALFTNHPEWFLRDNEGKPLRVGINYFWSWEYYALNFYHPEVQSYLKKVFSTLTKDWGFNFIKIDFLFAVCLQAQNGKSRAAVMNDAMLFIRKAVGENTILLGCGIPIGTASGTTDYCRIGPDVHLKWENKILKWLRVRERLSTVSACNNTIGRRQYSRNGFLNDPDVVILRKNKQQLTKKEQYTLLLCNLIFGDLIFTSDDISLYDKSTQRQFRSIFPLVKKKEIHVEHSEGLYKILFQIDDRRYLAYLNLSDRDKIHKLSAGIYFDGFSQEILTHEQNLSIPKHQSILLHICSSGPFGVLGSDGHFFPGSEITKISLKGKNIQLELREELQLNPTIYLKVPKDYIGETVNGQPFKLIQKKNFAVLKITINKNQQ